MKKKTIFLILLLAFLVRLIALNQSLWLDEAVTANVVSNLSYSEIISKFSPTDFHPPLFYLVEKLWTNIFGYSEIALRMPSIIFSLIIGWILYKIAGNWAVALFLFNPLIIYYSQEARMYMMTTFFVTLIIYFLQQTQNTFPESNSGSNSFHFFPGKLDFGIRILLLNLFIFLSFLTFYGSVFFIFAVYLWLLFKKQYKIFLMVLPGLILAGILILPLFVQQYANSKIALSSVQNWSLVLGKANLKNLLLIPIKFSIGRISFEPKILYWLVSGLWTTLLFSFILRPKTHLRGVYLGLFWLTLLLGFVTSFFTPVLQYFRFLYLVPIFIILITAKIARPARSGNWQGWVVLTGFLIFSFIYLLNPAYHREDWKSLVKDLKVKDVYMIASSSDPIRYYNKNIKVNDLRFIEKIQENEITVIPYTSEIHGVTYAETLGQLGYRLGSEKNYRELKIEKWIYK